MIYGKYLLRGNTPLLARNPVSLLLQNRRGFAISTNLVKDLRNLTGSPLKDCMKALEETEGDIEKAKDLLRKKGLADASKRTGRATTEGLIGVRLDKANNTLSMVEMHCETDFVAKTD
jgi:elongation factor Ts